MIYLLALDSIKINTLNHLPLTLTKFLQDQLFILIYNKYNKVNLLQFLLQFTVPCDYSRELLIIILLDLLLLLIQLIHMNIHLTSNLIELLQETISLPLLLILILLKYISLPYCVSIYQTQFFSRANQTAHLEHTLMVPRPSQFSIYLTYHYIVFYTFLFG